VRTLFVVEPGREEEVRAKIRVALAIGRLVGPDGSESTWRLRSSGASAVRADEAEQTRRLANGADA
jgi:hypothetical protein